MKPLGQSQIVHSPEGRLAEIGIADPRNATRCLRNFERMPLHRKHHRPWCNTLRKHAENPVERVACKTIRRHIIHGRSGKLLEPEIGSRHHLDRLRPLFQQLDERQKESAV